MRTSITRKINDRWAKSLILWLNTKGISFCFRGSGWGKFNDENFDLFAGFGSLTSIEDFVSENSLNEFVNSANDYIITHLTYDVKNRLERLESSNPDLIKFPELRLTIPEVVFKVKRDSVIIEYHQEQYSEIEIDSILQEIEKFEIENKFSFISEPKWRLKKLQYTEALSKVKRHIKLGNTYQANYCQEVFWENATVNSAFLFNEGFDQNPNPFSVFYKLGNHQCISFSPERFLAVKGSTIFSQPMKGTAPRGNSKEEDTSNMNWLKSSEKDRRENVMIVDMVRNDLSHFAARASVTVPELYKVETYPKVHQMYSTVRAELKDKKDLFKAILKCFPMGSMTGAPKISAMQIIEELEHSTRGIFSGTIGYITPEKNADFNVIIRSLVYNEQEKILSCHVGGGITDLSNIEEEFEECEVKIAPILKLINRFRSTEIDSMI